MRILEVADFYSPWVGGPASLIENLCRGFVGLGHDVRVLAPSPSGPPWHEAGEVPIERARTWPLPFGYRLRWGAPIVLADRLIARWRPDVVHIHHPFPISLAAISAARRRGVPVVATNHTIPSCSLYGVRGTPVYAPAARIFGAHITRVLRTAAVVATPTGAAADMLARLGFSGPVTVISNGVDTVRFRPQEAAASRMPTVLYTGRLDAEKDLETLIRAIPRVLRQMPTRFVIGGEGADRTRLERLVYDLGVGEAVRFSGYVPAEDLPRVYRAADVYVMTSPVELQSMTTLEALASGLPVVAADAAALPELVRPGVNGLLCPVGNADVFADALASLLRNRPERARMGRAGRALAESHELALTVRRYTAVLASVKAAAPQGVCSEPACG